LKRLKRSGRVAVPLLCLALLIGCTAGGGQDQSRQKPEPGKTGHTQNYRFHTDNYRYLKDDGRFGNHNSNPNLSDVGQRSDSRPPRDVVKQQLRHLALQEKGVKRAKVEIMGGHAAIQVTPDRNVPRQKYPQMEEVILRKASQKVPRYEIRVRVGWSKWNPLRYFQGRD